MLMNCEKGHAYMQMERGKKTPHTRMLGEGRLIKREHFEVKAQTGGGALACGG